MDLKLEYLLKHFALISSLLKPFNFQITEACLRIFWPSIPMLSPFYAKGMGISYENIEFPTMTRYWREAGATDWEVWGCLWFVVGLYR